MTCSAINTNLSRKIYNVFPSHYNLISKFEKKEKKMEVRVGPFGPFGPLDLKLNLKHPKLQNKTFTTLVANNATILCKVHNPKMKSQCNKNIYNFTPTN
jgi:hypothetical protein